ncbi:MAG: TetR/AcrR family transcriptional regulator [Halioglobus sp.]
MLEAREQPKVANRTVKRRQRTRAQILRAVESLVLSNGYDDTSAEAIAELADLGRSTFYNHFTNKQEAVLATVSARFADYGQDVYVPVEQSPDRAVALATSAANLFKAVARDPFTRALVERPRLLIQALIDSQYDFMVKDVGEGIEQGRFKFVSNLEQTLTLLIWGLVGLLASAIAKDSVDASCRDWCRLLLLNVGIPAEEIEDIVTKTLSETIA